MIVIGLTGSIGMGKSEIARQFASLGAKVCSADAIVHMLLHSDNEASRAIKKVFPEAVKQGGIDRKALGELVFGDLKKRRQLEEILHPVVVRAENNFVYKEGRKGAKAIVLDIPLLFETGAQKRCHVVVVASAPHFLQRQRVMKRPGMTEKKFAGILKAQLSDRDKRRRGDILIQTGLGKAHSFRSVLMLMKALHAA